MDRLMDRFCERCLLPMPLLSMNTPACHYICVFMLSIAPTLQNISSLRFATTYVCPFYTGIASCQVIVSLLTVRPWLFATRDTTRPGGWRDSNTVTIWATKNWLVLLFSRVISCATTADVLSWTQHRWLANLDQSTAVDTCYYNTTSGSTRAILENYRRWMRTN